MTFSRILLKLSGESLMGNDSHGISAKVLKEYVSQILEISDEGCEIAIVIGGGNIFRGVSGTSAGFDRVKGDQMGMLATVINSLALESEIIKQGGKAKVFTSIRMEPVGELYNRDRVSALMKEHVVCIIAGGTGNPFFTTDTAAALRAVELSAGVLLKGTRVDGVYNTDPERDPSAIMYDKISYDEVIRLNLKVMDSTAFTLCRDNNMPMIVFNMNVPGNLARIVKGEKTGTLIN
ncbi:MAG: UMP kinase [Bacteroidales bacterium]|nr:UMP kinase [Bacteroidales bacterium]